MFQEKKYPLLIIVLTLLFFVPFIGNVHLFDWDEINFAAISREMLLRENWTSITIGFQSYYEKPPLFFWFQAMSMKLFGINEFAARLPNALCGTLSLYLLFRIGKQLYNAKFGLLWALVYFGSILPHFYFKSGLIDPWLNLFIFLGLYFSIQFSWSKEDLLTSTKSKWLSLLLAGVFIGLAMLAKGQVAYIICALVFAVYWLYRRFYFFINVGEFLLFTIIAFVVFSLWLGVEWLNNGPEFIEAFFIRQYELFTRPDAGHGGFMGYHFVVLLVGCFPASILGIRAMRNLTAEKPIQKDFRIWMLILFWVVLILFTIVKTKIVHYSSLCYFPLTYLASLTVYNIIYKKIKTPKWIPWSIGILGGLFVIITAIVPYLGINIDLLKPLLEKDAFALENIQASVNWSWKQLLPSVWLLATLSAYFYFYKKGILTKAYWALLLGNALFVQFTLFAFIGRVEQYSQAAAIEICEEMIGQDVYFQAYGYKTYTDIFYAESHEETNPKANQTKENRQNWLLHGDIDKDAYFLTRTNKLEKLKREKAKLELIKKKNGFYLFKRLATQD